MDDFFENHGVDILAKHVEQEPVTHLSLFNNDIYAFLSDKPEPNVEQVSSHSWRKYYN